MMFKKKTPGFTLIEALIVVTILSLAVVGLINALSEGDKAYRLVNSKVGNAQKAANIINRLTNELGYADSANFASLPAVDPGDATLSYTDGAGLACKLEIKDHMLYLTRNGTERMIMDGVNRISFRRSAEDKNNKTVFVSIWLMDSTFKTETLYTTTIHSMN